MGYTHYWGDAANQPVIDRNDWAVVRTAAEKIIAECGSQGIAIQFEKDDDSPPQLANGLIRFNGAGDDGHETFLLDRHDMDKFAFCKTARKPYDLAVVAILEVVKAVTGLDYRSDGSTEDRAEGIQLARKVLP